MVSASCEWPRLRREGARIEMGVDLQSSRLRKKKSELTKKSIQPRDVVQAGSSPI